MKEIQGWGTDRIIDREGWRTELENGRHERYKEEDREQRQTKKRMEERAMPWSEAVEETVYSYFTS